MTTTAIRAGKALAPLLLGTLTALLPGQGILIPTDTQDRRIGPVQQAVETTLLQVDARIEDGAATTELVQTLHNRTNTQQEAIWLLPLPAGATADRFSMTVGGVETPGEVLDATRARTIYEDIVRRRRDPGLLEYVGTGMLRARVFPIPPLGDVVVKVRWSQLLPEDGGVRQFRFPLRAAWADGNGPQKLGLAVDVRSKAPIKTVWSPLPGFDFVRDGDHRARGSIEFARAQMPQRDLALFWGTAEQDFGVHVLTHRGRAGEPGYFLMLLSGKRDWPRQPQVRRSITLVIDTSGSMAGEKIAQARAATASFLKSLPETDWFNVVPFSTDARPFFAEPVRATRENVATALERANELQARGGTNIDGALDAVIAHPTPDCYKQDPPIEMLPIVVFLTDGLPTVGATDVDALLTKARKLQPHRARLFAFGVGHDVNTRLLDTMAAELRGDRGYVQPDEDIERVTSALFEKLSGPVMTDPKLAVDQVRLEDLEPRSLPDLFVQGQIAIVGRYHGTGASAIRLTGKVGDAAREYVFEATFPEREAAHDWLPTLWAQRRVATLLDAIRLRGSDPELVAEITRLGKEHGIVTPYTSHLVVEEGQQLAQLPRLRDLPADGANDDRLRREWTRAGRSDVPAPGAAVDLERLQREAAAEATTAAQAMTGGPETGKAAVDKSRDVLLLRTGEWRDHDSATGLLHRAIGSRVFHLVGATWVDRALTPELAQSMRRVEAFSDDHFALLRERPQLKDVLAFSTSIVVVDGGQAFAIHE